jgi:type I restriction enzyme S subunit
MAAVAEEFGGIDVSTLRPLREVVKGYTAFRTADVLFAKITPCMENGKVAVVPKLECGWGFGSTEFHVIRAKSGISPRWLGLYLSQHELRREARRAMTGSAGQLRVPLSWLSERLVPIAPSAEQERIIAKIEELFSDLDAGVAALERVRANLKRYRAAVLKAAVEGKLTEDWRAQHPDTEPPSALLARILTERRRRWEAAQFAKFAQANRQPPRGWRESYEDPKPTDEAALAVLPYGWRWVTVEQLNSATRPISYGVLQPGDHVEDGIPLVRVCDVVEGKVLVDQLKRIARRISEQYQRTILQGGEVLLTVVGTIGRTAIAPESLRGANTARAVAVLPLLEGISARYVELALRETSMRARLTQVAHEVARKTLNLEDVRAACLPLPPLEEQAEIVAEVERRLSIVDEIEAQVEANLKRAARLRQGILKRAFEGRLVPQDPADEPAEQLLARIKGEPNEARSDGSRRPRRSRRPGSGTDGTGGPASQRTLFS